MSAQSIVYLYNQRETVVLLDHSSTPRRYEKVYSKNLILNKGVDNLIEFVLLNTDQKPIDITDKKIIFRIIDFKGEQILLEKELTHTFSLNGITTLRISKFDLLEINAQKCFYSLVFNDTTFTYPVFVDSFSSSRGVLFITDSIFPKFTPSIELSVPSHPSPLLNKNVEYTSSIYTMNPQSVTTVQYMLNQFTGDIAFEGSSIPNFTSYYNITNAVHENNSGSYILNINGYHSYLRLKIKNYGTPQNDNTLVGDLIKILVR